MGLAIASFAAFAASQVGTPGPANMALMATGARYGFRRALPFVGGVILGKQLIIWPIGFGIMGWLAAYPAVFEMLKWASVVYIMWLAWKIANLRMSTERGGDAAPGFVAGLAIHPLNPKAWAMIVAGFTGFVDAGTDPFTATLGIAAVLLACQCLLHPVWTFAGDRIAEVVAGTGAERILMWTLAALTVASVLYALLRGGGDA
ncbi:LysE family translocator [Roseovarius sp. SCSIO 43702]|uniref:LysE family translocator n=1 Tax=Roseovarius sp. SCSIO 43702 TaxID=2823043 RepID=UPI001C7364D0|nr:LysE family translocator [Roseovarius sp. SCSIO 43702]QYX55476.1 LysE family translocator [Roseovarius sp. SCSIO 43702]